MPNLHSKQVKIWTDLQEQIMDAGLMTDAIEWPEDGNPVEPFVSSVDAAWLGAALLVAAGRWSPEVSAPSSTYDP